MLWTGFFVLEGFDFGVGMLHGLAGRDEAGRRAAINTIGPLWDGNEVWLIVAGAAMFAAFPGWYATMFSGMYLALVLLLAALIVRGVSFEYRGKHDTPRWRRTWSTLLTSGSLLAPLLIGVALGDLLHGLPINSKQEYTGSFWTLLQPYGLFTGITLVALCVLHGATFLALKTTADVRERAGRLARRVAPVTAVVVLAFASWTHVTAGKGFFPNLPEIAAVLAVFAAAWLVYEQREGWAFAATTFAMADHRSVDVRRPLSPRHGVEHQQGVRPDHQQHRRGQLRPEGDDRRRGHLPAVRARLPGMDLLRLPAAHQPGRLRRRDRARRRARRAAPW